MKKRAFHFEIRDILTQFLAAFDDTIISRHEKRVAKTNVEVRYVLAPKQRVMHDIVNKAHNLTLPVVAVSVKSITRDPARVFGKNTTFNLPAEITESPKSSIKWDMPVPINIEISMSILARYMSDIDQIISNFVPYNNPYVMISWPVPEEIMSTYGAEIRSKVNWGGGITYDTPLDSTYSDKIRTTADTTFTIEGWLFPEQKNIEDTIYKVDANFINVDLRNRIYHDEFKPWGEQVDFQTYEQAGYQTLSSYGTTVPTNYSETVTVSGIPTMTNIFYATTGTFIPLRGNVNITDTKQNNFLIYGTRFDRSNTVYLSSNTASFFTNYTAITSAKSPTVSGYLLDSSYYNVASDNVLSVFLPASTFDIPGSFVFLTRNEAGWGTSYQASSSILTVD